MGVSVTRALHQRGSLPVVIAAVIAVVAVISLGAWYVKHNNKSVNQDNSTTSVRPKADENKQITPTADPYGDWNSYDNTVYGISFRYPRDWRVEEGPANSPGSATRQEYVISMKRTEDTKYSDTVNLEILGEGLGTAAKWYDNYFAQAPENETTKTTIQLKGRESVQYAVADSAQTKLYLLGVGDKTYLFTSINEELNAQADTDYRNKFDKVFDSLHINSPQPPGKALLQ